MNCDRIAPFYETLERIAFGSRLQRHRAAYLKLACDKKHALVLGDGDGRFTAALAHALPDLAIDYVEKSAGMLAQAGKRLKKYPTVSLIHADVFDIPLGAGRYDIVLTHFFLDCFDDKDLQDLIQRVRTALRPEALWIVSDFRQAAAGWRKVYTRLWLSAMYAFFRIATGLKTKRLPDYGAALSAAGFVSKRKDISTTGLIVSECWQLAKNARLRSTVYPD